MASRSIEVQITGDSSSLEKAFGRSRSAAGRFGANVGKGVLAAGAALVGLGGIALKTAIDFESSFAGVRKTVEATPKQFDQLAQSLRNMAKEIPTSVNELNKIAESAGALGIERQNIVSFTRTIADMGQTTNLVGEEAAATMARLANITRMPQTEFRKLGSTIVDLGNKGASTEAEIAAMGLRLAAAGNQAGMSLPQILGFANAMSSVGIEAEAGGSAMSRTFAKIGTAVMDGGAKLRGFAAVAGMSGAQFQKAFKTDAAGAVLSFVEGLSRVKAAGGNVYTTLKSLNITDVRATDALLRLAGAGDLARKSIADGTKAWQEGTALSAEAAKRYETLASKLTVLRNKAVDIGITLGTVIMPAVAGLVGAASAAADAFSRFVGSLGEVQGVSAKLDVVWSALASGAASVGDALASAFNQIDWAGISAGLQSRVASIDWSGVGTSIGNGIAGAVERALPVLKNIGAKVSEMVRSIDWVAAGKAMGPGLAAAVVTAFVTLLDPAFWVRNWDLALAVALVALGGSVGRAAGKLAVPFARLGVDAVLAIVSGIEQVAPRLAAVLLAGLLRLPGIAAGALGVLGNVVSAVFSRIGAIASFAVKVLGVQAVIDQLARLAAAAAGVAKRVYEGLTQAFANAASWLVAAGGAILQGLWDGMVAKWNAVAGWLGGLAGKIASLKGPVSKDATLLTAQGGAIILGLETGMMTAWSTLAPKISALGGDIIANFVLGVTAAAPQFTGKLAQAAEQALEAARATVQRYQGVLGDAFARLGDFVRRAFEAKTADLLSKVEQRFDAQIARWRKYADAMTPAERELAKLNAAEDARSRQNAVRLAQDALTEALAMAAGVERDRAVAAAKEQIRQADLANTRAALEARAATERAMSDALAAEQIAALEAAKARELQNLEERRRQLGESLDAQLATLQGKLAQQPEEYAKIQRQIVALLASYGIQMRASGKLLGEAFAAGLDSSAKSVQKAAKNLANIVARYLRLSSPAEAGPLASLDTWFSGFVPSLLRGIDYRLMEQAAARLGMAALPPGMRASLAGAQSGATANYSMSSPSSTAGSGGGVQLHFYAPVYADERGLQELTAKVVEAQRRAYARNR